MKSVHCFPKIHLEHSITQSCRKLLTLKHYKLSLFLFLEKMKAFAEKQMFKHNRPRYICLSKGRKLCDKSKKCFLCGKGIHRSVFINLSEFNTLNGIVPATTLKIDSWN